MEQSIPGTRDAVITNESLKGELDNLRGFRHVARNIYTHELQPSRVLELAKQLPDCYQALEADLQKFCQSLESGSS